MMRVARQLEEFKRQCDDNASKHAESEFEQQLVMITQ